jgi:hypothetical protein
VTHPFGTPGARHNGLAFASVETLGVSNSVATTADTGNDRNEITRIAGPFKRGAAPNARYPLWNVDDRADVEQRHQGFH